MGSIIRILYWIEFYGVLHFPNGAFLFLNYLCLKRFYHDNFLHRVNTVYLNTNIFSDDNRFKECQMSIINEPS